MARIMRGCLTAQYQPEGAEVPETNPSVTKHEVPVDYDLDVEFEWSKSKNEPVAQKEKEENSDTEYANMEITYDRNSARG